VCAAARDVLLEGAMSCGLVKDHGTRNGLCRQPRLPNGHRPHHTCSVGTFLASHPPAVIVPIAVLLVCITVSCGCLRSHRADQQGVNTCDGARLNNPSVTTNIQGGSNELSLSSNIADVVHIASFSGFDMITAMHVGSLLTSNKVPFYMMGSKTWGIFVKNTDVSRALQILRADATNMQYYLTVYEHQDAD
jgi:hypothetical protein